MKNGTRGHIRTDGSGGGEARSKALDPMVLYELVNLCLECQDLAQFKNILMGPLPSLLPHVGMIAVIGEIDLNHLHVLRLIEVNAPPALAQSLGQPLRVSDRSALNSWLTHREPMVLGRDEANVEISNIEAREISEYRMGCVAAHGEVDLVARSGSYFSFFGVEQDLSVIEVRRRLGCVIPPLHQAFMRLHKMSGVEGGGARQNRLTATEIEILEWVSAGRSNIEIAQLRGRSVATVRNQLHRIYEKLGVAGRVEAIRWLQRC